MEALKNFRKTLDSIPWVIELLLVIFFDGLYGGIYRMTVSYTHLRAHET